MSDKSIGRKRFIYDTYGKPSPTADPITARAGIAYYALLWVFVAVVIAGSYSSVYDTYQSFFEAFFSFVVIVLALELALRLWACTVDPAYRDPIKGRLKYLFTTSLVINAIVVVVYLGKYVIPGSNIIFNSAIVLIMLKLVTRSRTFSFVFDVLNAKRNELAVALVIDIVLLVVFASLMFVVMHPTDPAGFSSIPASAWWAAQTLTTVGYGDLTPTTPLGQLLAIVTMFLGIATFAIPIAIVGAGFMEAFDARRGKDRSSDDPVQLLWHLKELRDGGAITDAQFKEKQKEVLARL